MHGPEVRRPCLDADGEGPGGYDAQPQSTEDVSAAPGGRSGVLPVTRQDRCGLRTVGFYEVTGSGLRWRPAVDVQRLAERGQVLALLTTLTVAVGWVARGWAQGRPAVGRVTMGPGGWISVRVPRVGSGRRAMRPHEANRPWWARLTHADRLIVARPHGR